MNTKGFGVCKHMLISHCAARQWQHVLFNFRPLQSCLITRSSMLRFYCMVDLLKLIWNWMTITCWRAFSVHRNDWVTICAQQSKEKTEKGKKQREWILLPWVLARNGIEIKKEEVRYLVKYTGIGYTQSGCTKPPFHTHTHTHTYISPSQTNRTSWAYSCSCRPPKTFKQCTCSNTNKQSLGTYLNLINWYLIWATWGRFSGK